MIKKSRPVCPPHGLNGEALRVAPNAKPGHGADSLQLSLDLDAPIASPIASRAGAVRAAIGSDAQCVYPNQTR